MNKNAVKSPVAPVVTDDMMAGAEDAYMKAEALEDAAEHTVPAMHQVAEWLRSRARCIRKQGAEASNDR